MKATLTLKRKCLGDTESSSSTVLAPSQGFSSIVVNNIPRIGDSAWIVDPTTDALDVNRRTPKSRAREDLGGVQVRRFANVSNALAYHHQLFLPLGFGRWLQERIDQFDVRASIDIEGK